MGPRPRPFSVPDAGHLSRSMRSTPSAHTIRLVNHGFNDGDNREVQRRRQHRDHRALRDGATYKVAIRRRDTVQAARLQRRDHSGCPGQRRSGCRPSPTKRPAPIPAGFILARIDTASKRDHAAQQQPDRRPRNVTYASLEADGNDPIGGLTQLNDYTVKAVPGSTNSFQLIDPTTHQVVQLGDPGAASVQSFGFIKSNPELYPRPATHEGGRRRRHHRGHHPQQSPNCRTR